MSAVPVKERMKSLYFEFSSQKSTFFTVFLSSLFLLFWLVGFLVCWLFFFFLIEEESILTSLKV